MNAKITLISLLLITIFIGCNKKSEAVEAEATQKQAIASEEVTDTAMPDNGIEATVELNDKEDALIINCTLAVKSEGFSYSNQNEAFTHGDLKGITFRYSHSNPEEYDIFEPGKHLMNVQFEIPNEGKWNKGDLVRIMPVNENDEKEFISIVDSGYFTERMEHFGTRDNIQDDELIIFNTGFKQTRVNPRSGDTSKAGYEKSKQKAQPRLTKKDLILSITKR